MLSSLSVDHSLPPYNTVTDNQLMAVIFFFSHTHSLYYIAQMDLRNCSMLVVGAGGLGASCALYLGAAGVGRLGIVDHDTVDISNLHRQVIHNEARQGMSKARSAALSIQLYV